MSAFILDGNVLSVTSYSGFDIADDVKHQAIIPSTTPSHDEVLQTGGLPMPQAQLAGRTTDPDLISALDTLRQSHASVTFQDPEGSRTVVVEQFSKQRATPASFLYTWALSLVEPG